MKVFAYVVENGSFRSAADHFNLSPTMIGKHVSSLEESLNTRLIHRTTRKQSLTDSGKLYFQECQRILEDISNAENLIQTLENRPQGTVTINCPVTYGNKVLAPIVAEFLIEHPEINVELMLSNELIDPYKSESDLIIRIGELSDSSLVARHIGDYKMIYCASPDYINRHPKIESISDLSQHHCLRFRYTNGQSQHTLNAPTSPFKSNHTRLASNNGDVLKYAALQGVGVLLQPMILVEQEIKQQKLIQVLKDSSPQRRPIHLLYKSKQLSLKNRTFADFVIKRCRGE